MKKFSLFLISLGIVMLFGCASTQSVKELTERVDGNARMIDQNATMINQNAADIDVNNSRLDSVEKHMDELFTRSMSK